MITATMERIPEPDQASCSGSSILSSAEAYVRREAKKAVKQEAPYEVRVSLRLRVVAGSTGVATALVLKRSLLTIPSLKPKRQRLDNTIKLQILEAAKRHGTSQAIALAHNTSGFEHVDRRRLYKWRHKLMVPKRKAGRKGTSEDFNYALLDELMFLGCETEANGRVSVEANVAFSYAIIRHAAELLQAGRFKDDMAVKGLKFSKPWIRTWSRNMRLRRRRVTTVDKVLPAAAEVQEHMLGIQQCLIDFELDEIISADETGINYGILPVNQLVPDDARRGSAPESDEKARITAMLWGTADGKMQEQFIIIKCSAKGANLTNTRVLSSLHQQAGFTGGDGWALKVWTRTLTIVIKKKDTQVKYSIPYLVHEQGQHVITIQHRAWMDTARLCMWIDLQLGPHYDDKRGIAGLVWDNCGPHGTKAVKELASDWGISILPLPKNMTDVLQVMDLVVNSPVKAAMRRERTLRLLHDFQQWKLKRLEACVNKQPLPRFNPPKPKVHEGITTLLACNENTFASEVFQQSLKKCFVDSCIAPEETTEDEVHFKEYQDHKHGSMNPRPHFKQYDKEHELGSLGMALDTMQGVTVSTLTEAVHADLSDDEAGSADDSDSESDA